MLITFGGYYSTDLVPHEDDGGGVGVPQGPPDEGEPVVGDGVEGVLVVDGVDDGHDVAAAQLHLQHRVRLLGGCERGMV